MSSNLGVKEILRRFDDDVGVGVEDNVFEVAEVEFTNDAVAAIFLFPNASVKEDIIFCPTAAAAFTADRSSLSTSDETIPGFIAQWTARCYENRVLWYLLTVLTYQSHVTSL